MSLTDVLAVIVIMGIAGAFLHWIYEHVVRFSSISDWRRCPECDRMVLRKAQICKGCRTDLRAPAPRAG